MSQLCNDHSSDPVADTDRNQHKWSLEEDAILGAMCADDRHSWDDISKRLCVSVRGCQERYGYLLLRPDRQPALRRGSVGSPAADDPAAYKADSTERRAFEPYVDREVPPPKTGSAPSQSHDQKSNDASIERIDLPPISAGRVTVSRSPTLQTMEAPRPQQRSEEIERRQLALLPGPGGRRVP